jgi:hypothetical protein
MRKPVIFIVIVAALVVVAIAGSLFYQRWHDSPRYALQQMVLAIKARDMDKVFKYLDLKEIFNNFLESSTEGLKLDDQGGDEWSRFSRQLGRKFARKILPQLFDNFEKQIRQAMESYLQNLHNTQILALTAAVTTAGIKVQGEEAQVTIQDPKTKKPLRFRMRRSRGTGDWRVVSVNYDDFKDLLKKEFLGISPQEDNV